MATLFGLSVFVLMIGAVWFFIARPILEDYGVLAPRADSAATVNHSQPLMSTPASFLAQTNQTDQTDESDDAVSEADRWLDRLEVDRSRTAIIELMVYSGWNTSQVRAVLKGDSGMVGAEVEAAKIKLGIAPEPRLLKVRDNGANERVIPFDERQLV